MGVIFKHTLKNMFSKPFRTIMLMLCIVICSFAGMMTFDMSNSIRNVLKSAFLTMFGDSNVMVTAPMGLSDSDFEGLPEHEKVLISNGSTTFNVPGNTTYKYFNEKSILIYCADPEEASKLNLLASDVELTENEVAIPKALSEELNLQIGDTIEFYDEDEVAREYQVKSILPYKGILSSKFNVLMSYEGYSRMLGDEELVLGGAFVKVLDESRTKEFCEKMEEQTQGAELEDLINGEMITSQINSITSLFAILFMICLMLVIFVTISLSERIMVERMGTVGTLRSLGVSPNTTAKIVLFENALYGLIGGLIGSSLYVATRDPIFNNMFSLNSGSDIKLEMNLGSISVVTFIAVVIGAIVIECLCPIKELLKATRTSIRDLIFDNKDADYKYLKRSLIASVVMTVPAIVGLVLVLTKTVNNLGLIFGTIILLVAGLFLGFPFILRAVSILLEKLFTKANCPIAAFSCVQARTKKASVGICRLCTMAVTIGLTLFVLSSSYLAILDHRPADADVVIDGLSEQREMYSYVEDLDGVTDVEYFYYNWGVNFVLGEENVKEFETANSKRMKELYHSAVLVGTPGSYELFQSISGLPETIADDEIYMDKDVANGLGYKVGDEIPMIIAPNHPDALSRTLKLAGYCDTIKFATGTPVYVISLNNYTSVFRDYPSRAFIRCEDPQKTIETIKERSACTMESCYTMDEYAEQLKNEGAGISTVLYMLIIMGVLLTFIAVVSNQIIGFSGRRRECAVLTSTAMSRGKLKKAFFTENLVSSLLAVVVSIPFAALTTVLFQRALEMLEMNFGLAVDIPSTMMFIGGMFVLFLGTVLMPIRNIRKMKIAEQLKYE